MIFGDPLTSICADMTFIWLGLSKTNLLGAALLLATLSALPAAGVEFDVYILTGQSNSLGTTNLETPFDPGTDSADEHTEFFWSNVNASNTIYPPALYGDSEGVMTSLQMQQGDGGANPNFWGPEFGMARDMFDAGLNDVLIIKASRGGGGNGFWDKATFDANPDDGHMWGHLRDTIDAGLAAVINQGNTFEVKGLMYLQGESNNAEEAAIADTRLNDLINNLQSHIHVTYPDAADSMHTVVGEIAASHSNANRVLTTQKQIALAAEDPQISFVATNDLPLKSDGIHFARDAKLTIGSRFANVFIGVTEQPNGVIGDVNQDGVVSSGTGNPTDDDVAKFIAGWQTNTSGLTNLQKTLAGDLNHSGRTTLADAYILHGALDAQGLEFPFEALNNVPEPGSCGLLCVGGLLVSRARAFQRNKWFQVVPRRKQTTCIASD